MVEAKAVSGAVPRAVTRVIQWDTRRIERRLQRSAVELAERFAAKGMTLTANEILVEVGLEQRRW